MRIKDIKNKNLTVQRNQDGRNSPVEFPVCSTFPIPSLAIAIQLHLSWTREVWFPAANWRNTYKV